MNYDVISRSCDIRVLLPRHGTAWRERPTLTSEYEVRLDISSTEFFFSGTQ